MKIQKIQKNSDQTSAQMRLPAGIKDCPILAYALKELLAQRVTSLLVLLAVILSAAMTAAIGQSAGMLSAMRKQQAASISGSQYATFVQMNAGQVEALQNDKRLSHAGVSVSLGTVPLNRALTLGISEYHGDSLTFHPSLMKLKEGRLPQAPMELALPEDVLQFLGFSGKTGDTITLSLSKALRHGIETTSHAYTADFTLTGITESNYMGYAAGIVQGIAGEGTAEALLPERFLYYHVDIRTADHVPFQPTMDDLVSALHVHELDMMYNTVYLDAMGIPYDADAADTELSGQGFSLLSSAGIMVGALLLSAAGFVIFNILKITVSKRKKQYGILRAVGAAKGQLYFLVTAQILLLCAIGIPAGLFMGSLSAKGILTAATSLLSPEVFLVQDQAGLNRLIAENSAGKWAYLLAGAAVTLLSALAAALPAALFAAKVPPVTAISGAGRNAKPSGSQKTIACRRPRAPIPARMHTRREKRSAKQIRNFERYYARLNLRRNRGRTAVTVLSLVMGIAVYTVLQGSISLLDAAGEAGKHLGDYSVINETAGFSAGDLKTMEEDSRVAAVAAMQFSLYTLNGQNQPEGISLGFSLHAGESFQVVGLNAAYLDAYFGGKIPDRDLERLQSGAGCIVRNPVPLIFEGAEIARTEIQTGSTITVAGKELQVLDTMDGYDSYLGVGNGGFTNGIQVIVDHTVYPELTGENYYQELLPTLKPDTVRGSFDQTIKALAQRVPGTTWISYEETDRQFAVSFAQTRLLAWGVVLFLSFIGILNIINTVYTNLHTRMAEIGIQRAIGMSAGSLSRACLWEGAYYGIYAFLPGGILGCAGTFFLHAALKGSWEITAAPFLASAEAAVAAVAACLLAAAVPVRSVAGQEIVRLTENTE